MKQLPDGIGLYKQTPEFNESTIPAGLLKDHQTKEGTWAKIIILDGKLCYRINGPDVEQITLSKVKPGVVEPAVMHSISPLGTVRLYIEFYR